MISWRMKTRGLRPIGLDIGHSSIKMIQLAVNGEQVSVHAADKIHIDRDVNGDSEERRSFVISTIKQMLVRGNFQGRNVVSCLPNDKLKITSLRLAEAEMGEIEQVLRKEVSQRFGLNPERDLINFLVAGSTRQGDEIRKELILFAADNETIKQHINMLEEARLRPVAIDTVPCALFRSFERLLRRQEDREHTVVFVDLGKRFTTVVFGCGGEISFVKQMQLGGEKFNHEIAAKLGISAKEAEILREHLRSDSSASETGMQNGRSDNRIDALTRQAVTDAIGAVAEELAREISLCFRYYTVTFRGKRVERAVLTGGEAHEGILLDVLRGQLPVEIEVAQPLKGFDMTDVKLDVCKRGSLCDWAVAVGLSLKGWQTADSEETEHRCVRQTRDRRGRDNNERN
ncbi:MAG: pilus assembly protein PilM [Planctomycetota bacterium]|nr:MAG: pilus assembly protein PilM [Planctomycetota bacterium]